MEILFHKNFKKQYKKLSKKIQTKCNERLVVFMEDNKHPLLNVHSLQGKDKPLVSMNITGDHRALFIKEKNVVTFHKISTHSELYS